MRAASASAAVLIVLSLAGCASAQSEGAAKSGTHNAQAAISPQQQAALEGSITEEEYQLGFKAFEQCLSEQGYSLVNATLVNGEYDYRIPDAAMRSGASDECYEYHWQQIDVRWQDAHIDESETARIVAACLRQHGIAPAAAYQDNVALLTRHRIDPATC